MSWYFGIFLGSRKRFSLAEHSQKKRCGTVALSPFEADC